jgi:hypothetical protein
MQAVVELTDTHETGHVAVEQAAIAYVKQTFSYPCRLGKGRRMSNGDWHFLVQYISSDLKRPETIAKLHIDGRSHRVTPLAEEEQQKAKERILIAIAGARGELPLQDGYVPRLFACRRAGIYLDEHVGFFFTPVDGIFIPLDRPVWQFSLQFRLPHSGNLGLLDTIDVDAQTGNVIPLPPQQITDLSLGRRRLFCH